MGREQHLGASALLPPSTQSQVLSGSTAHFHLTTSTWEGLNCGCRKAPLIQYSKKGRTDLVFVGFCRFLALSRLCVPVRTEQVSELGSAMRCLKMTACSGIPGHSPHAVFSCCVPRKIFSGLSGGKKKKGY